ncbi:glycosyltransferase [bacterium]|nr:glycosyltransferase [bacterium]
MNVLLNEYNLFNSTGGGQTVYRKIVSENPDIMFYYFISKPGEIKNSPVNTTPIILKDNYSKAFLRDTRKFINFTGDRVQMLSAYTTANLIAKQCKGMSFDVIDTPDYRTEGLFLRQAFKKNSISVGKYVLALHGNTSVSESMNFNSRKNIDKNIIEQLQFYGVDQRYGISENYINEWKNITQINSLIVSPINFINKELRSYNNSYDPIDIVFLGRTEKRKGPDLFVNIISMLQNHEYGKSFIYGPDDGENSNNHINNMIKSRSIKAEIYSNGFDDNDLKTFASKRTIVIIPSRYDTFNLIALECLAMGIPIIVGKNTGVASFLNKNFKSGYEIVNESNVLEGVGALRKMMQNYDIVKSKLYSEIQQTTFEVNDDIREIYCSNEYKTTKYKSYIDYLFNKYRDLHSLDLRNIIINGDRESQNYAAFTKNAKIKREPTKKEAYNFNLINKKLENCSSPVIKEIISKEIKIWSQLPTINSLHECDEKDINKKIQLYEQLAVSSYGNRSNYYCEIARLERIRGNYLIATCYYIRVLRLSGNVSNVDLEFINRILTKEGYHEELKVLELMYVIKDQVKIHDYLKKREFKFLNDTTQCKYNIYDFRTDVNIDVSIIVSVYNGNKKIIQFLQNIYNVICTSSAKVEVIMVETGSETKDLNEFLSYDEKNNIEIIYIKSDYRETIQAAWNRGIEFSRGRYLSFLGLDEGLFSGAIDTLMHELDHHPEIDWVMGNSFIMEVDKNGNYKNDSLFYNRTGYTKDLAYLETCYLSWVGGMYKKSIHTRYGMYDNTFSAAGDTEFKNRILKKIQTKHVDQSLGYFFNYPEDRATCSPNAEIEDIRAWYVFRTEGGVKYVYENKSIEDVQKQLINSLLYRKSFYQSLSTDYEYALNISNYCLNNYKSKQLCLDLVLKLTKLITLMRLIELPNDQIQTCIPLEIINLYEKANELQRYIINADDDINIIKYQFNDNRYEQHIGIWEGDNSYHNTISLNGMTRLLFK